MGYLRQSARYTLSPASPALPLGLLPRSGTTPLVCPTFSFSSLLVWWRPASFNSISTLLAVLSVTCASDDGGHKWPGPLACQSPPGSAHSTISWEKCTMILGELWTTGTHGGHPGYVWSPAPGFPTHSSPWAWGGPCPSPHLHHEPPAPRFPNLDSLPPHLSPFPEVNGFWWKQLTEWKHWHPSHHLLDTEGALGCHQN